MRRSHKLVSRPCALGLRGALLGTQAPAEPRFSRELTKFLLRVARARALAGRDPAAAARQLSDWIDRDG
jgi:hypothetical protein